jgi:hypothetical protein
MPTNTYVALQTQTLGTAAASVTFSSIPQGYTDLVLISQLKNTGGAGNLKIRFNGDTASNYSYTNIYGNGSSASSGRNSNQTEIIFGQADSVQFLFNTLNIFNYTNTTTFKTTLSRSNDAGGGNLYPSTGAIVGLWRKTPEAITSFSIFSDSNIASGSTFTIYGIAATSVGAKATGGTIYSDSQYFYHVFAGNGTFTPTQSISADVLCVAGGGGGAGARVSVHYAGGGGAGGVLGFSSQALTATNYTVTVGGGGAGGVGGVSAANGTQGGNSQFASLTASVGGGSGATSANNGGAGGSGGGGGSYNTTTSGGAATSGQGFAGGGSTSNYYSGGGGGAGAVGTNGTGVTVSGYGGAGTNTVTNLGSLATMLSATGIGVNGYIAGGGQGTAAITLNSALGGGGMAGGDGGSQGTAAAGVGALATGSGGGAGAPNGTQNGAAGGSGVVIVRYLKA